MKHLVLGLAVVCALSVVTSARADERIVSTLSDLYCYDCQFETNKLNNGSGAGVARAADGLSLYDIAAPQGQALLYK